LVGELLNKLTPTTTADFDFTIICYQAWLRRQYSRAAALFRTKLNQNQTDSLPALRAEYRLRLGDAQRWSGDVSAAKSSYSQARGEFEQQLKEQPENAAGISANLALTY